MPRQVGISVENSFIKGLITEATGLNFPENACTETYDCVFDKTGEVSRRLGIQLEDGLEQNAIDALEDSAITEFLWKSVSLTGERTFFVMQRGSIVSFWSVDQDGIIAPHLHTFYYDLNTNKQAGSPDVSDVHASFAAGNGALYVAHPYCNPVQIEYIEDDDTFVTEVLNLLIRDVSGVNNTLLNNGDLYGGDPIASDFRPTTLSGNILYNLMNQGWDSGPTFRLNRHVYGGNTPLLKVWRKGVFLFPNNAGGAFNVWQAKNALGRHDWPSEADFWTAYKRPIIPILDEDGNPTDPNVPDEGFALDATDDKDLGNSPAPKGHYLYDAFNIDRWARILDTYTHALYPEVFDGLTPLEKETSGYARPSQIAFYAGRVWYAGVDANKYNTRIYFSWIVENNLHSEKCYQRNDPTASDAPSPDLLPSDGGVVVIPDIARVIKLVPFGNSLLVFATNGIWQIAGPNAGAGFTATDYGVVKIASVGATSFLNFVDADGTPLWWNSDGIYTLKQGENGILQALSLTNATIQTFYDDIPVASRRFAKGVFNLGTKTVQWVYRSTAPTTVQERYHYDRILNLDLNTGSFYPWTISDSCLYVAGITVLNGYGSVIDQEEVTDDGVVVTDSGDPVTDGVLTLADLAPRFKYVTLNECEEVPLEPVDDGITYNGAFVGHLTSATFGAGNTDAPTSGVMIGEDGEMYLSADETSLASAQLQRFATGDTVEVNYATATYRTDLYNITSPPGTPFTYGSQRIIPIPGTAYFYAALGVIMNDLSAYCMIGLYKINSSGAIEFTNKAKAYEGSFTNVPTASNAITIHAVDFSSFEEDPLDRTIVAAMTNSNAVIFSGSKLGVVELPSVNDFIATSGVFSGDSWTGLFNTNIKGSEFLMGNLFNSSSEADRGTNTCFFVPTSSGYMLCKYVSYALAKFHIDNPSSLSADPTILSFASTYPNGFIIGNSGSGWSVINGSFGGLIPFTDLGQDKDEGSGSSINNDWFNANHQYDAENEVHYLLWLRHYDPIEANFTPTGDWRKLVVQVWNPNSQTASTFDEAEGSLYDTVSDLGAAGFQRYGTIPRGSFAFFNTDFDEIYVYSMIDGSHGGTGTEYTVSKFGDFEISIVVPTVNLAFSEFTNSDYIDWPDVTIGFDYDSYFISGYKIRGEAMRKFQSNYMNVYTRNSVPSTFDIYGRWDYALSGNTGRWNSVQRVIQEDTDYAYRHKRLKMRGHGKALQFKVNSVTGEPFNIIGWSLYETTNSNI